MGRQIAEADLERHRVRCVERDFAPHGERSGDNPGLIVASRHRGMPIWRDRLFAFMHRNAAPATGFFRIPGNRLVELGAQVEI